MTYGLQIWNAAGDLRLDTNYRVARYVATYSGSVGTSGQTITVTGLATDGTWGYNNSVENAWEIETTLAAGEFTVKSLVNGNKPYHIVLFRT